jgi:hypothetical protein
MVDLVTASVRFASEKMSAKSANQFAYFIPSQEAPPPQEMPD